jgi:hypothetical protein
MKKVTVSSKVRSSYEELVYVNEKLRAIQEGELDDATKEKIGIDIFEAFHKKSVVEWMSAGKAMKEAEQAYEEAKEVFNEKSKVLDFIASLIETDLSENNL